MQYLLGVLLVSAACGRIGFDGLSPGTGQDGAVDGDTSAVPEGMVTVDVTPTPFDFQFLGASWKQVTLTRSFYLDRNEVTVGRFKAWVDAGKPVPCTAATADGNGTCALDGTGHFSQMRWQIKWNADVANDRFSAPCGSPWALNGSTYPTGNPALPMSCITWSQALAFCAWDGGKRLPTQVEWNYEARGRDHRSYVWGDQPATCARSTFLSSDPTLYCGYPVPVGSGLDGASASGTLDLNGSVWEWGWDGTTAAGLSPTANDVPANSTDFTYDSFDETTEHVLFGGEWGEDITNMDLVNGNGHAPGVAWSGTSAITTVGLRCARTK